MGHYTWESSEDYTSQDPERDSDYAQPSVVEMIDRNLCYCHLAHSVFSDTVFASTVSRRGNRCAQVYFVDFRSTRAFPMASRNEAHMTLLLLFARDGVLPSKVSFIRSSEMLHVTWNSWSHILHGQMLHQERGWSYVAVVQTTKALMGWLLRVGSLY